MINIKQATNKDYEAISNLVKEVHQIHVDARPRDYKDVENPLNKPYFSEILESENYRVYLAETEEEQAVGYTILRKVQIKDHPIMKDKNILHMEDLCVSKDFRRKGVGEKLFDEAKGYCEKIGFDSLELQAWAFNKEAIKFYDSLGMKVKAMKYEMGMKSK